MTDDKTVLIGAGQASARCAIELRRLGYEGSITMLGIESVLPYQRPELSKSFLSRPVAPVELNVLSDEQAAEFDIDLQLNVEATEVNIDKRQVMAAGRTVPFDKLVFACGGFARPYRNALSLRTIDDAKKLFAAVKREKHLTVVGGGWLGLEVAATARSHGLEVTLFEQQQKLGARALPADMSELLLDYHRGIGVNVQLGSDQDAIADAVANSGGAVCTCIGIEPNDAIANAAGIDTDRGILVNDRQMTSVPNVFAIGDCAREQGKPSLENWAYANVSAERAAYAIADIPPAVEPDLWLWSKQGDLLLQMRGDCKDASSCIVRKLSDSSAHFYLNDDDTLAGCIVLNNPALFGQTRSLYRSGRNVDRTALADTRAPLNRVYTDSNS